jgi:hypothetical protein
LIQKKFEAGRKYITTEVFPWLSDETPVRQKAVLVSAGAARRQMCGAEVVTVDEFVAEICEAVQQRGIAAKAAISEHYPLLRTIQACTVRLLPTISHHLRLTSA